MPLDLAQVELFASLPPDAIAQLQMLGRKRHFAAGSVLIRQGDPSDVLYVLLEGTVRVERVHPQLSEPLVLAELGPGEVAGEIGVLDGQPRTATVTALEDVDTLALSYPALIATLLQHPEATTGLLRMLAKRLRNTDERIEELARRVTPPAPDPN